MTAKVLPFAPARARRAAREQEEALAGVPLWVTPGGSRAHAIRWRFPPIPATLERPARPAHVVLRCGAMVEAKTLLPADGEPVCARCARSRYDGSL